MSRTGCVRLLDGHAQWTCTGTSTFRVGTAPWLVEHHRCVLSVVQGFGLPPSEPVSALFIRRMHLLVPAVLLLGSKFKIKVKLSQNAKVSWLQIETKQRLHSLYGFNLKS